MGRAQCIFVMPASQLAFPVAQSVRCNCLNPRRWKKSHQRATKRISMMTSSRKSRDTFKANLHRRTLGMIRSGSAGARGHSHDHRIADIPSLEHDPHALPRSIARAAIGRQRSVRPGGRSRRNCWDENLNAASLTRIRSVRDDASVHTVMHKWTPYVSFLCERA